MVKKIRLDFTKVEERSGWNTRHMPEGLHSFTIVSREDKEASDGTDMAVYALRPTNPKYKTRLFPFYCKLQQNQYWKLRDLFVAAGETVPKKVVNLDLDKIIGREIAAEVEDETGQYEGRSTINGTYPIDILDDQDGDAEEDDEEYDEGDDEDEVDEDEEEDEEDDLETLTLPELRKLAKSLGIDHTGVKKGDLIELIREEQEADEDEDDEDEDDLGDEDLEDEDLEDEEFEDDEEEEEEAPAPRRRPAAKAPAKKAPAKATGPVRRTVKRR